MVAAATALAVSGCGAAAHHPHKQSPPAATPAFTPTPTFTVVPLTPTPSPSAPLSPTPSSRPRPTPSTPAPTATATPSAAATPTAGHATPTPTPAASSSAGRVSPSPSLPAGVHYCRTQQLQLQAGRPQGAAGNLITEVGLTNRSHATCAVQGYPYLFLRTGSTTLGLAVQQGGPGERGNGSLLRLPPGGHAAFAMRYPNQLAGGGQCKTSGTALLELPHTASLVNLGLAIPYCTGRLQLTSLYAAKSVPTPSPTPSSSPSATPSPSASPSATASPSPSPLATPSAPAPRPVCHGRQLSLGASMHRLLSRDRARLRMTVTNKSHRLCALGGYPFVFLRRGLRTLALTVDEVPGSPGWLELKPGEKADFSFTFAAHTATGVACATSKRLSVELPQRGALLTIARAIPDCTGKVAVSALSPAG